MAEWIRVKMCLECGSITRNGMICKGCGELLDEHCIDESIKEEGEEE